MSNDLTLLEWLEVIILGPIILYIAYKTIVFLLIHKIEKRIKKLERRNRSWF